MNNWLLKKLSKQTLGVVLCFVTLFSQATPAFAEDAVVSDAPVETTSTAEVPAESQVEPVPVIEPVADPVLETVPAELPSPESETIVAITETPDTSIETQDTPIETSDTSGTNELVNENIESSPNDLSSSSNSETVTPAPGQPIAPCVVPTLTQPVLSESVATPSDVVDQPSSTSSEESVNSVEPQPQEEPVVSVEPQPETEIVTEPATETNPDLAETPAVTPDTQTDSQTETPQAPTPEDVPETQATSSCLPIPSIADGGIQTEDGSIIDTTKIVDTKIEIINTNDVKVINEANSESISGSNAILAGDSGKGADLTSGDVNVFANILTVVNTNSVNSQIASIAENFNNLTSDLILNNPAATPAELTQDLVSQVCTDIACKSLNSFNLTNKNVAEVENNVNVLGDSGKNRIERFDEEGTIRSGNVNALVNILNIVNTNLYNSRWTIATINIFGDWQGDLVLPSELYFNGSMSIGATDNSLVNQEEIRKIIFDVSNTNNVGIENNVAVDTDSGNNSLIATGTPEGKKGDIDNSSIETGDSQGLSNVKNFLNTNIVNSRWYIGMVNTLGAWSGNVFSLPEKVAMAPTPTGLAFFSTTANQDEAFELFKESTANFSDIQEETIAITNENDAVIRNNVNLGAYSGENTAVADELENSSIKTGHTFGLANILNFANTNLINSNLHLGMINIFGSWQGNIHFGFPDLEVTDLRAPAEISGQKGQAVNYELDYKNEGDASVSGATADFHYDADKLAYVGNDQSIKASQVAPGVVTFELGKVSPRQESTLNIKMKTIQDISVPGDITTFARLSALVPERNEDNNEKRVSSPLVPIAPGDNSTSGSSDGSSGTPSQGGTTGNGSTGSSSSGTGDSGSSSNDNSGSGSSSGSSSTETGSGSNAGDSSASSGSPSSTGASSGSGSSNGGNQDYSGAGYSTPSPRGLIRVFSTNTAAGRVVRVGDTVEFQVKVSNDGIDDIYNVVLNDVLRGPDGAVITRRSFPLGKLLSNELVEISYELEVTTNALAGVYNGTVSATGLNGQLQAVQSESSSISYFTVERQANDNQLLSAGSSSSGSETQSQAEASTTDSGDSSQAVTKTSEESAKSESDSKTISAKGIELSQAHLVTPVVLSATDSSSLTTSVPGDSVTLSTPKIARTSSQNIVKEQFSGTPSIFEGSANTADAKVVNNIKFPEWATFLGDGREATPSSTAQLVNIIAIAFLIAVGYALASVKEKFKKAKRAF
jgi:uncharacterized repeat protein (TIGR01451 family)